MMKRPFRRGFYYQGLALRYDILRSVYIAVIMVV